MNRLHRQLEWDSRLFHVLVVALAALYGLALVHLSQLNAFLLIFFSFVGVTTLIEPLVGLLATLFLGILRAWLFTEVPEIPSQIAMPVLALTLASWLLHGATRRELRLQAPPLFFPLLLFFGTALLSLWDAVELSVYGLPELLKWVQILVLFWLVTDRVYAERMPWLVGSLLLIGVFQGLLGLWQFVLRGAGPEHFAVLNGRLYRAYGTFEQPNPYAGYLGLVFPLGLGLLMDATLRRYWTRTGTVSLRIIGGLLLATVVIGAALVASWSRGGWLGMVAATVVVVAALPRRPGLGFALVAAVLVGVLALGAVGFLPASVSARLTDFAQYARIEDVRGVGINDANYAVIERLAHWQAALEMWRARFWTGVGFGDYEPAYPEYRLVNWPIALGHAHNYYLNVAAETGVIGLVGYLVLWAAVFWQTWRAVREAEGWQRGLAIGLLGAWVHLSVHHLFDNLYVNNVHLHIGVMLGLVALLATPANTPSRSRPCADPNHRRAHPSADRCG
jgi:O-antigen ligase